MTHHLTRRDLLSTFAAGSLASFARAGLARAPQGTASEEREDWSNWSGAVKWQPRTVARPTSTEEAAEAVRAALRAGEHVRVAGTGHSFTPLCATDGTTMLLTRMRGVLNVDAEKREATVLAGTKLYELEEPLREAGFALETLPDIDRQSVAGALATATHGTGRDVPSLSTLAVGAKLVDGGGDVRDVRLDTDEETMLAVQASLGATGVLTEVTLRLVPAFRLHEKTAIVPFDEAIAATDRMWNEHRHFEFFWVSDRDACLFKTLDPTDDPEDREEFADETKLVGERVGPSGKIFTNLRNTRFNEIEYAVPAEKGKDCWREIRDLMKGKHKDITWPLEYRMVAPEKAFLSMAEGRRVITLSLHQGARLEHEPFFRDAEAIFRNHGGRPHWGKMHWLEREELQALYPEWDRFQKVRRNIDPDGRFLTPYLKGLLA